MNGQNMSGRPSSAMCWSCSAWPRGRSFSSGARAFVPPDARGWTALLAAGFVAAVFLEWAAQVLALWDYSTLVPTIRVFGHTVGLAPA